MSRKTMRQIKNFSHLDAQSQDKNSNNPVMPYTDFIKKARIDFIITS